VKPILIAHRGASEKEPENTLASFKRALNFPFTKMIELDVYAIPSGEVVVIHDNKVDRTTNGKGYVMESSFEYLRSLDAGYRRGQIKSSRRREKIPTLNEVLDLVAAKVKVNIELKGENTAEPVKKVIAEYLKKGWKHEDFLVSSFHHEELRKFKRLMPRIPVGVLFVGVPLGYAAYAQRLKAYSFNLSIEFINQQIVDDAHRRGIKVFCWTLEEADEIERMCSLGIDGIFVNDLDFAHGVLTGTRSKS
jgi:glycerophosphoryl diester phosphodiesterase